MDIASQLTRTKSRIKFFPQGDLSALPPGGYVAAAVRAVSPVPSSIRSGGESLPSKDVDLITTRVIERLMTWDAGGARDVPLSLRSGRQIQRTHHRMLLTRFPRSDGDVTHSETLPIYEE
jgi:hypothetical protein